MMKINLILLLFSYQIIKLFNLPRICGHIVRSTRLCWMTIVKKKSCKQKLWLSSETSIHPLHPTKAINKNVTSIARLILLPFDLIFLEVVIPPPLSAPPLLSALSVLMVVISLLMCVCIHPPFVVVPALSSHCLTLTECVPVYRWRPKGSTGEYKKQQKKKWQS